MLNLNVPLRIVFCYWLVPEQGTRLVRLLAHDVVKSMTIEDQSRLKGESLVAIGYRDRAETFPNPRELASSGKVLLPRDAQATCAEYADWIGDNRNQVPQWFSADHARQAFEDCYPFHPMLLSVFERKWQELPHFQQTRGMLRLLALWVSRSYVEGFQGKHRDPLIGPGSAPLDNALVRSALFEQLGEDKLEGAVTSDICVDQFLFESPIQSWSTAEKSGSGFPWKRSRGRDCPSSNWRRSKRRCGSWVWRMNFDE